MIYLDNAATTFPKPDEVYDAVYDCMKYYGANPGRSGHKMALQAGRIILEAREELCGLFNIKNPMSIIFTHNATDSLNLGIKGLLKENDHVITTSMEHNSVIRPVKALENIGVSLSIVKCSITGEIDLKDLEKEIRSNTRLIVTTHASNVTGTILPIKQIGEIAKKYNVIYMVDAAQTAGVYDIDVEDMNIDLLAFPGHKSLLGPQGVGGLYVKEGIPLRQLKEGGTGSKSESLYQPDIIPDRYESGTPNTPGIAGLLAGVKFIKKAGIKNIREHEQQLTRYFIDKIKDIEGITIYGPRDLEKQAPVVSINIGETGSSDISFILDNSFNIATRPGLHCSPLAHITTDTMEQGTVRFSFGYFNTVEEIDYTVEALKKIAKEVKVG